MHNKVHEILTGIAALVCGGFMWREASALPVWAPTGELGSGAFPKGVIILILVFGAVQLLQGICMRAPAAKAAAGKNHRMLLFVLWFLAYIGMFVGGAHLYSLLPYQPVENNLVFFLCTFIYLAGALIITGRRSKKEILLVSLGVPAVLVACFAFCFQIMLP